MSNQNNGKEPWMAFATFNAPNGETWHLTVRDGVTLEDVGDMFDIVTAASAEAASRGFDGIVEGSEFGGTQWKSGMPVSLLKAERIRRREAMEKAQAQEKKRNGEKALARNQVAAAKRAMPTPASHSAQQISGFKFGHDLTKSPIEISKIVVQGTKDKPQVQLWSSNPGLKHPVWSNVSPGVLMACFLRDYNLADMVSIGGKEMTRQAATSQMITEIGKEIDGIQWFVSWQPSEKNPKWKDITGVQIPKWKDIRIEDDEVPS